MEQLQLQIESRLFEQDEKGLAEMIELLETEDDLAGKSNMERIKIITKTIDSKMAAMKRKHQRASNSYLLLWPAMYRPSKR